MVCSKTRTMKTALLVLTLACGLASALSGRVPIPGRKSKAAAQAATWDEVPVNKEHTRRIVEFSQKRMMDAFEKRMARRAAHEAELAEKNGGVAPSSEPTGPRPGPAAFSATLRQLERYSGDEISKSVWKQDAAFQAAKEEINEHAVILHKHAYTFQYNPKAETCVTNGIDLAFVLDRFTVCKEPISRGIDKVLGGEYHGWDCGEGKIMWYADEKDTVPTYVVESPHRHILWKLDDVFISPLPKAYFVTPKYCDTGKKAWEMYPN